MKFILMYINIKNHVSLTEAFNCATIMIINIFFLDNQLKLYIDMYRMIKQRTLTIKLII